MKEKYSFSGHDKFHCRQFWLKKGLDHIEQKYKFDDNSVVQLGVGRNMVRAIRFWVYAFGLAKESKISNFSKKIFSDTGYDPYLEDIGTIWLLHYNLVTSKKASLYSLIFNIYLRGKIEFTKELLLKFIKQYCDNNKISANESSLKFDIDVFIKNYALPNSKQDIESDFSGLLYELKLLTKIERSGNWFKIENTNRQSLAPQIILFCILKNADDGATTFSFRDLLEKDDSIGRVFCLNGNGLNDKLQELTKIYPNNINFSENAGVKVLQVKGELNCWDVLKDYYAN
jgi:hypothetical protein